MRTPNIFTDPSDGSTYEWAINHSEEGAFGAERQLTTGGNTADTGLIIQQGDDSPLEINVKGTVLQNSQNDQFAAWFLICKDQTIHFTDFAGDKYEVIITSYKPTRQRTVKNPRGGTTNPLHYWKYEMTMRVIDVLAGPWEGLVI